MSVGDSLTDKEIQALCDLAKELKSKVKKDLRKKKLEKIECSKKEIK